MSVKLFVATGVIFFGLIACAPTPQVLTELDFVVCPVQLPPVNCPLSDIPPDPKAGESLPDFKNKYEDLKYITQQCYYAVELRDTAWKRCKALSKRR